MTLGVPGARWPSRGQLWPPVRRKRDTKCSAPAALLAFTFLLIQMLTTRCDAVSPRVGPADAGNRPGSLSGVNETGTSRRALLLVGGDNRQLVTNLENEPYNSVVQLQMNTASGNATCSGVLISRELVLTASSCIFLPRNISRGGLSLPSWVYGIKIVSAKARSNRALANAVLGVSAVHVPPAYAAEARMLGYTRKAAENDYAVLRLSVPVNDPKIAIPGRRGIEAFTGETTLLGFPRGKPAGTLWSSRCQSRFSGNKATEWISCDATDGQEGGPLLKQNRTAWFVLGILGRVPSGSKFNRLSVANYDMETFIRKVEKLPRDPCLVEGRTCHRRAMCTTDGSKASCVCNPGLYGDGYQCSNDLCLARGLKCSNNGYCWDTGDIPRCRCKTGFVGDGVTCVRPTSTTRASTTRASTTRSRGTTSSRTRTRTRTSTATRDVKSICVRVPRFQPPIHS